MRMPTHAAANDALRGEASPRLLREAISMVAGGHSARVVLTNVHLDAADIDRGSRLAIQSGVRLVRLKGSGTDTSAVALERIRD